MINIIKWVVKIGGSLFPTDAIKVAEKLKGTSSLIITGGGEFANLIRKYDKNKTDIPSHRCTKEDFYNNYDTSFEYLNLNQYLCLDDYNHNIEGIYSDQVFSYYEFSVIAKNKTSLIDEYFRSNDCKLQFYYTDITIDLRNYEDPIDPFLNSIFIQLNPTLFIKRNIYYMNQYLYDDDKIITVFDDEKKPDQIKTLFSRYEEYSLYSGLEREKK